MSAKNPVRSPLQNPLHLAEFKFGVLLLLEYKLGITLPKTTVFLPEKQQKFAAPYVTHCVPRFVKNYQ